MVSRPYFEARGGNQDDSAFVITMISARARPTPAVEIC
jgi:hypothetical protein